MSCNFCNNIKRDPVYDLGNSVEGILYIDPVGEALDLEVKDPNSGVYYLLSFVAGYCPMCGCKLSDAAQEIVLTPLNDEDLGVYVDQNGKVYVQDKNDPNAFITSSDEFSRKVKKIDLQPLQYR